MPKPSSAERRYLDVRKVIKNRALMDQAFEKARISALRRHAEAGVPVVLWVNGKVKKVSAKPLLKEALQRQTLKNGV